MNADRHTLDERRILASFISILPEAILLCDSKGICLVHDRQSQAYLMPGQAAAGEPAAMVGRPVVSFIDRHLMERALDEIRQRLAQGVGRPISGFVVEKNNWVLQGQVVPVLNRVGVFDGFVVILSDITRQNETEKRVEALLTMLSKNARSPMASIRAAVEAIKTFPVMAEEKRCQFIDIIHSESLVLTEILEQASREYGRLIHGKKILKQMPVAELMEMVAMDCRRRAGSFCRVALPENPFGIRADAYTFSIGLVFLLDCLTTENRISEFFLSASVRNRIVYLDVAWQGESLSTERFNRWTSVDIVVNGRPAGICLKEVLDQHQSGAWAYRAGEDGRPFVRFFIPLDDTAGQGEVEPVTVLPENRVREMELFDHPDPALDSRLMTELAYTALIREIGQARGVEELMGKHSQLPRLIHNMLSGGTTVRTVTWLITAFSDAILNRLISFAQKDLGPAPVPFAFICLGSEGRKEQTLKTDQDNAIIFRGGSEDTGYFLALGETVCTWLDRAGYEFCRGGIMARNEKWCQPLSVWKSYFSQWIHAPSPEDLLHTSIFFDLRFAYGDRHLVEELLLHLNQSLSGWTGFFRNMAENAVYFKPPLGLFGRFQVERRGPHKRCLDIKMAGIPIVDFARIHALKQGVSETSTQDRLFRLYEMRVLSRQDYDELDQAYSLLAQLRFREQIHRILVEKGAPRNHINPRHLTSVERQMLKQVLKKIRSVQDRLRVDFIGATDQQTG